jgi:excisionase family DNA binding protein
VTLLGLWPDEAARLLGVSYKTIHRWLKLGKLEAVQISPGRKVITPASVAAKIGPGVVVEWCSSRCRWTERTVESDIRAPAEMRGETWVDRPN